MPESPISPNPRREPKPESSLGSTDVAISRAPREAGGVSAGKTAVITDRRAARGIAANPNPFGGPGRGPAGEVARAHAITESHGKRYL